MPPAPDLQIQKTWQQLRDAVSIEQNVSAITLAIYLLLGGALALYTRWLYRRFSSSLADADSVTRVFPLLTLVTIAVIAVVKSSMALSLGLVGALSIVRFRAAIKEPEELVYLFLCIGIGLGLGAGQPLLVIALVLVATLFVVGMHALGKRTQEQCLLLTVTGPAAQITDAEGGALRVIRETCGTHRVQRFDFEGGRGQVRIGLRQIDSDKTTVWIIRLREQLPDCEISLVDLGALV